MELVEALKLGGYVLVATDIDGIEDTLVLQHREKLLLALGNEASGLSGTATNGSRSHPEDSHSTREKQNRSM